MMVKPEGTDPSWSALYRAGAVSAGLAMLLYVVGLVIVSVTTAPPASGGARMLEYVDANRTLYIVRQLLWSAPSVFLMVTFLALAVALRQYGKSLAAIAGLINVASWAVSLAGPTTGDGSLAMVVLSDRYATLATAGERIPVVAGAEVLIALNDVPSLVGVLQTAGIVLISLLMLRGRLPSGLAWLGLATGVIGIVSEVLRPILGWAYAVYGLLLFVWLTWVAIALWRVGAKPSEGERTQPASAV